MISPEHAQHGPEAHDESAPKPATRPQGVGSLRKGAATYETTNGIFHIETVSRVGLTLDAYLADQAWDYREGLQASIDDGEDPATFARGDEDRAVWRDGRLVALLRATDDGSLAALELTPGDDDRGWRLLVDAAELTAADEGELEVPGPAAPPAAPPTPALDPPLTEDEWFLLKLIRHGSYREAFERLTLSGRYAELGQALGWWGSNRSDSARPVGA